MQAFYKNFGITHSVFGPRPFAMAALPKSRTTWSPKSHIINMKEAGQKLQAIDYPTWVFSNSRRMRRRSAIGDLLSEHASLMRAIASLATSPY